MNLRAGTLAACVATVLHWGREGGVLVCGDNGENLEIVSRGFRNPWDIALDSGFNFQGTDSDQNEVDRVFNPFFGSHLRVGASLERKGLEPIGVINSCNKQLRNPSTPGGAGSGALGIENASIDSGLARVTRAWPKLPSAIRTAILPMIDVAE